MHHGPAVELDKDNASEIKSRLGLWLFALYSIVYSGFVLINTLNSKLMETEMFWGLNLAVVYGFGLILFAIILGLIYNYICTKYENKLNKGEDQ